MALLRSLQRTKNVPFSLLNLRIFASASDRSRVPWYHRVLWVFGDGHL